MRRTIIALAACLVVVGLVAAPGALGKKGPRYIGGTVSLVAPSPAAGVHTTTATGNVLTQASCRKNRTVHLTLTNADGSSAGPEVLATTRQNGDYTAAITLPAPVAPAIAATYTLNASVDQVNRKSGKGHKSKKFICLALPAAPVSINVS
jgi:hypothetical protein